MKVPIHKIDTLIARTHQLLPDYPPELIASIVLHQFSEILSYLTLPTHPALLVRKLGSFYPSLPSVEHQIKMAIARYRLYKNPKYYKILPTLWKIRRQAQEYKKFSSYKKRFGSWHYKQKTTLPPDPQN